VHLAKDCPEFVAGKKHTRCRCAPIGSVRDLTPYRQIVEKIAEMLNGPADGNLPSHVAAMLDRLRIEHEEVGRVRAERDRFREQLAASLR
jgi:hypothetical protein